MNSTQNQAQLAADLAALPIPSQEQALTEALRQLSHSFPATEQIWMVDQSYDAAHTSWQLDILRRGAMGHWVRQRYRFDGQAETIYFLGDRTLSAAEASTARTAGIAFPVAEWQNK